MYKDIYKLSVIIPAYNVENYLERCLDSILMQTLDDIEIIVVNDASSDRTLQIAQQYALLNKNLTVLNNVTNQGPSITRNKGIEVAKGEYLYFIDSDDYIDYETLNVCYTCAKELGADMVSFDAKVIYEADFLGTFFPDYDRSYKLKDIGYKLIDSKTYIQYLVENNALQTSVDLYIIKRELLLKHKLLFCPNILHEDDLFTFEILCLINNIVYIPKMFYNRTVRNDSIVTSGVWKNFDSLYSFIKELSIFRKCIANDKFKLNFITTTREDYLLMMRNYIFFPDREKKLTILLFIKRLVKLMKYTLPVCTLVYRRSIKKITPLLIKK